MNRPACLIINSEDQTIFHLSRPVSQFLSSRRVVSCRPGPAVQSSRREAVGGVGGEREMPRSLNVLLGDHREIREEARASPEEAEQEPQELMIKIFTIKLSLSL